MQSPCRRIVRRVPTSIEAQQASSSLAGGGARASAAAAAAMSLFPTDEARSALWRARQLRLSFEGRGRPHS
jgi:hypothetical protein